MKLDFNGLSPELLKGVNEVKGQLGIELCECGIQVDVNQGGEGINIVRNGDRITLTYGKTHEFFRALSQIKYVYDTGRSVNESTFTTDLCFMADVSRNAVMNMKSIKRMIRYMALMGYSSFMLYTEDTFEVEGYPYFGYMRGRYSHDELREVDDYAYCFGIEVIPCIQTLAHLSAALRWPEMATFSDTSDMLLVGDEKTYEFIDAMLKTCKKCFRSNKINIGMDEAAELGLGKYLRINGYRNQHEIMLEHLNKVTNMCHEAGYHPMIWSDMFFRMVIPGGGYYSRDVEIPQHIIDLVPEGLTIIYWDYYKKDAPYFAHMVDCHLKFKNNPIAFAGGAWKWSGFAPSNRYSIRFTEMQMKVCREKGLRDIMVTCWGDDGADAAQFSALGGLIYFAEAVYNESPDNALLNRRALECLEISYDDLLVLDDVNQMPGIDISDEMINPSKYLLYNDPLAGLMDAHFLPGETAKAFSENAVKLEALADHSVHGYLYETMAKLCRVLELKAELSLDIRNAYKANDREALNKAANEIIPECITRLESFVEAFRRQWYYENKTFLFANQEIRLGGLKERLYSTAARINEYLAGEVEKIEELEQPVLEFKPRDPRKNTYPYFCHNLWEPNAVVGVM
jgi:hypothetical protein